MEHPITADPESNNPAAVSMVMTLDSMREAMRDNMEAAQKHMAKYYNRNIIASKKEPQFKIGDWVMVNAKNIKTKRPSKKLDYKLRGKFKISRLIDTNAYELELPPSVGKIHPVFHISLLEPYRENTIPGRKEPTPPPIDLEEVIYQVERIKSSELKKGKVFYLVSWKGYGPDDDIWEPYENLEDEAMDSLKEFHIKFPNKLRDPRVEF